MADKFNAAIAADGSHYFVADALGVVYCTTGSGSDDGARVRAERIANALSLAADLTAERISRPEDFREPERWAKLVRDLWVQWAKTQPSPKPSWLVPWEDLDETTRAADRHIAIGFMAAVIEATAHPQITAAMQRRRAEIVFRASPGSGGEVWIFADGSYLASFADVPGAKARAEWLACVLNYAQGVAAIREGDHDEKRNRIYAIEDLRSAVKAMAETFAEPEVSPRRLVTPGPYGVEPLRITHEIQTGDGPQERHHEAHRLTGPGIPPEVIRFGEEGRLALEQRAEDLNRGAAGKE